jgi:hypothetical protein
MNDFDRDNKWQREQRDSILIPGFYEKFSTDGRYVLIDKGRFATILQKRLSVDTIVQSKGGRAVAIEEKIVRWPGYSYKNFTLETDSCTRPGRESEGWMHHCEADYLLYCFQQEAGFLECHLLDFQKLKAWFWPLVDSFKTFGPLDTLNASAGRQVPIEDARKAAGRCVFDIEKERVAA